MHTILSSEPDAKYFPVPENRTECMVPEWLLMEQSCLGLLYEGSGAL